MTDEWIDEITIALSHLNHRSFQGSFGLPMMDEQEFERIADLPDGMTLEQLEEEFQKLLTQTQHTSQEKDLLLLQAYFELSDRQWHTYKLVSLYLLAKIEFVLIHLWDQSSLESTELLLGIIGRLGLVKTFKGVKAALDGGLSTSVRSEILGAIEEFDATVADPYSGLRKENL